MEYYIKIYFSIFSIEIIISLSTTLEEQKLILSNVILTIVNCTKIVLIQLMYNVEVDLVMVLLKFVLHRYWSDLKIFTFHTDVLVY